MKEFFDLTLNPTTALPLWFVIVATSVIVCFGCDPKTKNGGSNKKITGKKLAQTYCSSCHAFPEPSLLDKATWENQVLPRMAHMMGIYESPEVRIRLLQDESNKSIFPPQALIEDTDWKQVEQYYISSAPEQLTVSKPNIEVGLASFDPISPTYTISPPSTTLVKFLQDGSLFVGDALSKKLLQFDNDLAMIKAGNIGEGVVHLKEDQDAYWILTMGSFSPTDQASGMLLHLPKSENKRAQIIADRLNRPVHAAYGDLNQDGLRDVVISEFGKWKGQLRILYNRGNNRFDSKVLERQTGATKTFLKDFNQDGRLDIMTLFAQGKEEIAIFYNQGDDQFDRKNILTFSPAHGSTNMDLIDFDSDGDWDILYTAGDNADFKPILKPYHGIYLYENLGNNEFHQKLFYPLHGAYGAKMIDFDLDGDLDIAAISFFPDYTTDAIESFVYLENQGDYSFTASTFANNSNGRWIVMDARDKDGDGDVDLVLGSLTFEVIPDKGYTQKWIDNGLPFIILENTSIK